MTSAMRFFNAYESTISAELMFRVHRDELSSYGPKFHGVRRVERVTTESEGSVLKLGHRWTGDTSVIPMPLRLFVPAFMFVWDDRTDWDEQALANEWRITSPYVGSMVRMGGTHKFLPQGTGCRVEIEGDFHSAVADTFGSAKVDAFVQQLFKTVFETATSIIEEHIRRTKAA